MFEYNYHNSIRCSLEETEARRKYIFVIVALKNSSEDDILRAFPQNSRGI